MENDKICRYCYGCNKLENKYFEGVRNCKDFVQARDMKEYYEAIRKEGKIGLV